MPEPKKLKFIHLAWQDVVICELFPYVRTNQNVHFCARSRQFSKNKILHACAIAYASVRSWMTNKQHSKISWIKAGLSALKDGNPSALRAEPLAKHLGTTKGSFYWHFADVPTYHDAVIDSWRNDVLNEIVAQLSANGTPQQRLHAFGAQILSDQVDPAMRTWAKSHAHARHTITQIDEQRLTYISTLLASFGVANPAFALACYGTLIGGTAIKTDIRPMQAFTALIDLILALK